MSFRLFPKSPEFFELLCEQNRIVSNAAAALHKIAEEFTELEKQCQVISQMETECDVINRTIVLELSTTFITPIDGDDIQEINLSQEAILDHIQAVSSRLEICRFSAMRSPAKQMISNIREMVTQIGVMLGMMGSGKGVSDTVAKVKLLRKDCKALFQAGLSELYDNPSPGSANVVEIIKWTHVYDRIDKAFNQAWQLTKSIEGIVLKHV